MWVQGRRLIGRPLAILSFLIVAAWGARGNLWRSAAERNAGFYRLNVGLARGQIEPLQSADKQLARLSATETNGSVAFGRSLAYLALGRPAEAEALWRTRPDSAAWLLAWGQKRLVEEKYGDALAWFERLRSLEPDQGDGWYYAGLAYEGQQAWDAAGESYKLALSHGHLSRVGDSDIYLRLGYLAVRARAWEEAEAPLAQALAQDQFLLPENELQAHLYYADVLSNLGRLEQAQAEYSQVLALAPRHYAAHVRLAALAWQLDHDAARAEQLYQAAIQFAPSEKAAYKGLGELYRETGHSAEAKAMFEQVLRLDPKDNTARRALEGLAP